VNGYNGLLQQFYTFLKLTHFKFNVVVLVLERWCQSGYSSMWKW